MSTKVNNPFEKLPGYFCFGCSSENDQGLKLEFVEDGDYVYSSWQPQRHHQGYLNILHGGIQATLLDEISSWAVFVKKKTSGVTAKLDIRYKKPVYLEKSPVQIRARILEMKRNVAVVEAELFDCDGQLCAYSKSEFFTYSPEKAEQELFHSEL